MRMLTAEADLAVNYYHKALHLGCCSSPRSTSALLGKSEITIGNVTKGVAKGEFPLVHIFHGFYSLILK